MAAFDWSADFASLPIFTPCPVNSACLGRASSLDCRSASVSLAFSDRQDGEKALEERLSGPGVSGEKSLSPGGPSRERGFTANLSKSLSCVRLWDFSCAPAQKGVGSVRWPADPHVGRFEKLCIRSHERCRCATGAPPEWGEVWESEDEDKGWVWQSSDAGEKVGDYSAKVLWVFLVRHMAASRHSDELDRVGGAGDAAPSADKVDGVAVGHDAVAVAVDDEDWTARGRGQLAGLTLAVAGARQGKERGRNEAPEPAGGEIVAVGMQCQWVRGRCEK